MDLAAWHANPMTEEEARRLLAQARASEQRAYARSEKCTECRIHEMIALFWMHRPIDACFLNLRKTAAGQEEALVELVYGQLQLSHKLQGAMEHLQAGFTLAAPYLAAADYFTLLRRHNLLAYLHLSAKPTAAPLGLEALVREAGVIRMLKSGVRHSRKGDPTDTLG